MATILCLDTSTTACSAALVDDGAVLTHLADLTTRNHAALLSDMVKHCLDHARQHELTLNAVAVTLGPGSYTGLRIGLSEAKGLAYGLDIPLIGISTLELLAVEAMFSPLYEGESMFLPMIDARRMEVYAAAYNLDLSVAMPPQAVILTEDSFADLPCAPIVICGDGAEKAATVLPPERFRHIPDLVPLASQMTALAEKHYRERHFIDTAYATPLYVKEYQARRPSNPLDNL